MEFINNNFKNKNLTVSDLGSGTGAIAIAIKKEFPEFKVDAYEISNKAIKLIKKNIKHNDVDINIIKKNIKTPLNKKYDIVISNPPYIKKGEFVEKKVKKYEPKLALYAGNDGLEYYKAILKHIKVSLNDKYLIAFEMGYQQKDQIFELIKKEFTDANVVCKQDLNKKNRFIFIYN